MFVTSGNSILQGKYVELSGIRQNYSEQQHLVCICTV